MTRVIVGEGIFQLPRVLVTIDHGENSAKYRVVQVDADTLKLETSDDNHKDAMDNYSWSPIDNKKDDYSAQLAQALGCAKYLALELFHRTYSREKK